MDCAVFSFSQRGFELGSRIEKLFTSPMHSGNFREKSLKAQVKEVFSAADCIVFVGAAGIAVRAIAPLVKSKETDPAVIVVDELGRFVIPILSGHLGGANKYAKDIAELVGAVPVITTATDINRVFAVDTWAKKSGLKIRNAQNIKRISSALLSGQKIGFSCDYKTAVPLPDFISEAEKDLGILISRDDTNPFINTLKLSPVNYALGVGCRRGIDSHVFKQVILQELSKNKIELSHIMGVASIDLKAQEAAVLNFCREYRLEFTTYTNEELQNATGEFTSSEFVKSITGVDNVCERSAALLSLGGKRILQKTCSNGVTLAVYEKEFICDLNCDTYCENKEG